MKSLQTVVVAALVAVLSVIAWELDQVRRELAPTAAIFTPRVETREQRNQRLQREQQELNEDAAAIWSTPSKPKPRPR